MKYDILMLLNICDKRPLSAFECSVGHKLAACLSNAAAPTYLMLSAAALFVL